MTEDSKAQPAEAKAKSASSKSREHRDKNKPLTKIIIRRLPPSMEEDAFLEQISPIPDYDYFYFVKPDPTLGSCAFARAYINFVNVDDIFVFRDKFDGYIFLDEKGVEYPGIVEYAPFQRIPKKRRKKDPKCGTIESDPTFIEFIDNTKETDKESKEPKLEFSYQPMEDEKPTPQSTPLLEFLAARRAEKARAREERRLRDAERRKPKNISEKKIKDVPTKTSPTPSDPDFTFVLSNNYMGFPKKYNQDKGPSVFGNSLRDNLIHKANAGNEKQQNNSNKWSPQISKNYFCDDEYWESHFPALPLGIKNAYTSNNSSIKGDLKMKGDEMDTSNSLTDINFSEDDNQDEDVKKIKPRDADNDKLTGKKRDEFPPSRNSSSYSDMKDVKPFGKSSKSYKEQRRSEDKRRDVDKRESYKSKEIFPRDLDGGKNLRKDRKDKRDFPKERSKEVKKYSDTRKERDKYKYASKSDSREEIADKSTIDDIDTHLTESKFTTNLEIKSDNKILKFGSDIIPVTQLPVMNLEDLSRVIDEIDKNVNRLKLEGNNSVEPLTSKNIESLTEIITKNANMECRLNIKPFNKSSRKPFENNSDSKDKKDEKVVERREVKKDCDKTQDQSIIAKKGEIRRNSLESGKFINKEENIFRRHKSLEDKKSKSEEREESEVEGASKNDEQSDPRVERRIRNKDRPSLVIYQPGMGKFSKHRITKDKESSKQSTELKEN